MPKAALPIHRTADTTVHEEPKKCEESLHMNIDFCLRM